MATVPPPSDVAISSHADHDPAAATSASCRYDIGVLPAWFGWPVNFTLNCFRPAMAVTTATGTPVSHSAGPCSAWTSTRPR